MGETPPARRHLTLAEAEAKLRRGKQVEQYLGTRTAHGRCVVRFATLYRDKRGKGDFILSIHEVWAGSTFDLSSLAPVVEDEGFGEGKPSRLGSMAEVLDALVECGGTLDRFVNLGVAGVEYEDSQFSGQPGGSPGKR